MTTKQPITRKGQRKPYVKATRKQIEQRIESLALLLHCGFGKSQIHQVFRSYYGIEWRQTDRYMTRACAKIKGYDSSISASPSGAVFDLAH